jgi:amino acid adenylation domain-containing protein
MQTSTIEGFRLSPQQEHLWSLQQVDNNWVYRSDCIILIEGHVDTNRLEFALQNVVNRHEILRTCFRYLPGITIPFQVIIDNKVRLQQYNLSNCNYQEQEIKIKEIFAQLSQQCFDIGQGSILHANLITISPIKSFLFISLTAICADKNSLSILLKEIAWSYSSKLQKQLNYELTQYADFSEFQNQLLEAEETEIGREYWQKQDLSCVDILKISYENTYTEEQIFCPKLINAVVTPKLVQKIELITHHYHVSNSTFYLTCWLVLIWRLVGQSEIIVAAGIDGRKYAELENALGLFAQYLPLHFDLEDDFSFSQLLQQVDKSLQAAHEWQDSFSWEQIGESQTNLGKLNFLPFGFDFEQKDINKYVADDISFSIHKKTTCIERFKIKLSCQQDNESVLIEFYYDSNFFSADKIEGLAEQFHQLLKSAVKNPETAIKKLDILSDRALNQLLFEFNQTNTNYPHNQCIYQLFEEQAECTPDKIAITFASEKLTYVQLNTRANQLAHYLQKLGVVPDQLVGICIERSLDMVVGILGILKAGGAYVPLDPAYPQERLAFMLNDTQTSILLTQQHLLANLPPHNARTICLDTDWESISGESQENPAIATSPDARAYIIYTSGSTGKPKGTQITHRNLVNSTTARIAYYQEPIAKFLLLSSFGFDSSVAGIFWTLCCGGTLYLPEGGLQRDVSKLIELISQNHISHLLCLPSLYALILQQKKTEKLVSLGTVIVAGEACPISLVQNHFQSQPETSLFNEYGPTEATVWSSVYSCYRSVSTAQVSIGRAIANTQIYILDSDLHPVPIGVPGEIYISGEGLARGYLNHAAMTAEKFIPNPFSKNPGMRLYKTGDLACYLSDGNIEFLGRIDHQVKLRGFRIELEEINAVLLQHLAVEESVAIVREDVVGDQRLVAYIVVNPESAFTINDLRDFLQQQLPDYMVPSLFVPLKNLPLTPNGKIDRQALPAPDQVRPEQAGLFIAPRNSTETKLANIWAELLRIERIGVYDNFFDLGGHSLLATQLISRVRDAFQVELLVRHIFAAPTVADLATIVVKKLTEQADEELLAEALAELEELS